MTSSQELIEKLKATDLKGLSVSKRRAIAKQIRELIDAETAENRIYYWKPYQWQERLLSVIHRKTIGMAISSNKIGKTAAAVNIVWSWAHGFEPWNVVDESVPAAVKVGEHWRAPSSLGIKPPVDLIIVGEDWKLHLGKTIVREMKKWYPPGYATTKNEQGVEFSWTFPNKSTITLMCYNQEDKLFESFRCQGVLMDEPPPKSKYGAMSRGLLLDVGKVLMTMTPLKEAWILDDLVLSGRSDIGVVNGVSILANEDLYRNDMETLTDMGLSRTEIARFWDLLLYKDAA